MTLKKSSGAIRMNLPPMWLFLNDLQRLHELLTDAGGNVRYEFGDFSTDQPSDLSELKSVTGKQTIRSLRVECKLARYESVRFELGTSIFGDNIVASSGTEPIALATRARDLLEVTRRSAFMQFVTRRSLLAPLVTGGICSIAAYIAFIRIVPNRSPVVEVVSYFTAVALFFLVGHIVERASGTKIHLYPHDEHRRISSYLDLRELMIKVLIGVVSAIAVVVFQKVTGWSPK